MRVHAYRGLAVLAASFMAATAGAQSAPYVPLTDLLPPLYQDAPAEAREARCGEDGLECLRFVEAQLAEWEDFFGCDHRAVFPTVYRLLTREARLQLERDPDFFDDPAGFGFEALAFYELYEQMITDHLAGRPIPPAWQTAMDAAQEGDWTALHDMLLAINAHVQRDMPFALATVGLTLPDGGSRKPDHDRFNRTLNAAYTPIVNAVAERYDPFLDEALGEGLLADNLVAQQLIAGWREGVWRNAERLSRDAGTAREESTAQTIELQAELSAQLIKTGEIPGRRELRREHCEAFLAAQRADAASADGGGTMMPLGLLLLGALAGMRRRGVRNPAADRG